MYELLPGARETAASLPLSSLADRLDGDVVALGDEPYADNADHADHPNHGNHVDHANDADRFRGVRDRDGPDRDGPDGVFTYERE